MVGLEGYFSADFQPLDAPSSSTPSSSGGSATPISTHSVQVSVPSTPTLDRSVLISVPSTPPSGRSLFANVQSQTQSTKDTYLSATAQRSLPARADVLGSRRFGSEETVDTLNKWGFWNDDGVFSDSSAEGDSDEDITPSPPGLRRLLNEMLTAAYDAEGDLEGDAVGGFAQ